MEIDESRKEKVVEYLRSSERYDLFEFIKDLGIDVSNAKEQSHNTVISSPFASDSTPSFSISKKSNIYKCFASETGGDIISFMYNYYKSSGKMRDRNSIIEEFLSKDNIMKSELGFVSIYNTKLKKLDFSNFEIRKPKLINKFPHTFISYFNTLVDKDIDTKVRAVMYMQNNLELDFIIDELEGGNNNVVHENLNLELDFEIDWDKI